MDLSMASGMVKKLRKCLSGMGGHLLDVLYPRVCPICGDVSDRRDRSICWKCFSALPLNSARGACCAICGKIPDGVIEGDFICETCVGERPAFDMARTAMPFRSEARELIHALKYRHGLWLAPDLGDILEGCARAYFDVHAIDGVLPVPLNIRKFSSRTYNQSELLARELSNRVDVPLECRALARVRSTPSQTRLTAEERRRNVAGAFAVRDASLVRGRTLLVVDDVMTTGSTFSEIAAVLKAAGAWRVLALAIARD